MAQTIPHKIVREVKVHPPIIGKLWCLADVIVAEIILYERNFLRSYIRPVLPIVIIDMVIRHTVVETALLIACSPLDLYGCGEVNYLRLHVIYINPIVNLHRLIGSIYSHILLYLYVVVFNIAWKIKCC